MAAGNHVPTLTSDPGGVADTDFADAVDDAFEARGWMARARVAATGNVVIASALEAGDTIDGVTLAEGDVVLLPAQTTTHECGLYVAVAAAAGAASRHPNFAIYDNLPGLKVQVMEGTANADTEWRCTSNKGGTIGVTALAFSQLASLTVATQAEQETGTSTTAVVTPGRQRYHPTAVKAWGSANASGSLLSGHNVTSVTDVDVGKVDFNFTTAFSSSAFTPVASGEQNNDTRPATILTKTTGSVRVGTTNDAATYTATDPTAYHFLACGDL